MKGARPLLVAALLLALSAAPALADHVYSHQLRVFGRIVGPDGAPLAGAVVNLVLEKTQRPDQISFRSDCAGDYGFAANEHFHTHGISTVGQVRVTVFDPAGSSDQEAILAETVVPADRNLRKAHVPFELERAGELVRCPDAAENHTRTAFLFGRIWNATKETSLEGVTVWGEVPENCRPAAPRPRCQPVEVELTTSDGRTASTTVWTDNYGDWQARLAFDEPFTTATARATAFERTATAEVPASLHTAEIDLVEGSPEAPRRAPDGGPAAVLAALAAAALALGPRGRSR